MLHLALLVGGEFSRVVHEDEDFRFLCCGVALVHPHAFGYGNVVDARVLGANFVSQLGVVSLGIVVELQLVAQGVDDAVLGVEYTLGALI